MHYFYDGSFEGFLCVVYESYYTDDLIESISVEEDQINLFSHARFISRESEKTQKVYQAIESSISPWALYHISYGFLSETPGIEMEILHYLHLGFRKGASVNQHLTNRHVQNVHKASKKTSRELHSYLGLLRFQLIENQIYYAAAEPKANIVPLMASHFSQRMPRENWIIHDTLRHIGVIYNKEIWKIADLSQMQKKNFAVHDPYESLWQTYYNHIAIKERHNPKLRQSCMPKRYWQHLIEMVPQK